MLVGIGVPTPLIGSIAERFINRPVQEQELNDGDVLEQVTPPPRMACPR
jgi:hypothetical protein